MKKFIKILTLSTMCLGMPFLNACSFFRDDNNKINEIKEILVDYDKDGNALITINYTDSHKEPVTFVLPKGTDGEIGTGIKKVDYEQDEYGATTVTISFTGDKLDPVSFVLQPGKSISDVKFNVDDEGNTLIIFIDSDGNELAPITVFKGDSGVGIASIISEVDPDTGETVVSMYMTDDPDKENPVIVRIPEGKQGRGIESIVSEKNGSIVNLTINYTDGGSDVVSFDAAPNWTTGYSKPGNAEGYDGDYYFDIAHDIIYIKQNGKWEEAVNFLTNETTYTVSFDLNDSIAEQASLVGDGTYSINRGETFLSTYGPNSMPKATRVGYTFGGWSTSKKPDVTNGLFTDLTPVLSDMILYAVWSN